jgi:hypothetical protein
VSLLLRLRFGITVSMKTDKFSPSLTTQRNGRQRQSMQEMIQMELPLWKQIKILPTEKPIICEILFCGLVTRSVHIAIEMQLQRIASVSERVSIQINVTEEYLKSGTFEINPGHYIKKTGRMGTLL